MCVCKRLAVRALIPAGDKCRPGTIAFLSRPSWPACIYTLFPFTKPSLCLSEAGGSAYVLTPWCIAGPAQRIFDAANAAACLVVQVSSACEGGFQLSGFYILWDLFCLSLSVQATAEIRVSKWLLKVFLQGHENSMVSICRSVNKSNEFPGEVGGSPNQAALPQYMSPHPHPPMGNNRIHFYLCSTSIFKSTRL